MPLRKSYFGAITTVQAIIFLLFSIFLMLNAYCEVNFFESNITGVLIKTTYLHDPGRCGTRINIGALVEGMNNRAFLQMDQPPFTYYRTLYFIWANFIIAIFWLISNELMFREYTLLPWTMTSLAACITDFAALIVYVNDAYSTKTLSDIMSYIRASAVGVGNVELNSASAAPIMALVMAKGAVFIIMTSTQIIWMALDRRVIRRVADAEVEAASPSSPAQFVRGDVARIPMRLPRPRLQSTSVRMREMVAACVPQPAASPDARYQSTEFVSASALPPAPANSPTGPRGVFYEEEIRVRVPDGMLSLPQRLEKMIAEEARKFEVRPCATGPRLGYRNGTREIRTTSLYFTEFTRELPDEVEFFIQRQRKYLDHHAQLQSSESLPNLCDGNLYLDTSKLSKGDDNRFSADVVVDEIVTRTVQEGDRSRLRRQMPPRVDLQSFNRARDLVIDFKEATSRQRADVLY